MTRKKSNMQIPDTIFPPSKTLCNVCQCICHVFAASHIICIPNLQYLYVIIHERWKWLRCLPSLQQQNSEKLRTEMGILGLTKMFRQVNSPHGSCNCNTCALVHGFSRTGSKHISKVIPTSSQVSPPATTIYLGSFLPSHECGSTQLLSKANSVALHCYQVKHWIFLCQLYKPANISFLELFEEIKM